jgi:hypothetical protein
MFAIQLWVVLAGGMFTLATGATAGALPADTAALWLDRADDPGQVVVKVVAGEDESRGAAQCQKTVTCKKVIRLDGPGACGASDKKEARSFTVRLNSDGRKCGGVSGAAPMIVTVSDDEDGPPSAVTEKVIRIEDDENSPDQPAVMHVQLLNSAGGDIETGGPWLGISYGPVPKPLAAHLKLDADSGQMILNLAEGSPAAQAGLKQYDVIVKVDGETAPADVGAFLEKVRALKPGQECKLTVIHEGQMAEKSLTVGRRPEDLGSLKQLYENDLEELSQGRILHRGGMLEQDDQGNWLFKRFDLPNMPDVFKWLPEDEDFTFELPLPGGAFGNRRVFIMKADDKTSIRIERGDDEIKVTRTETDADGNQKTTTKSYAGEDELKQGDAEAYELIKKAAEEPVGGRGEKRGLFRGLGLRGQGRLVLPHDKNGAVDQDLQDLLKNAKEATTRAEEMRAQLRKQAEELKKGGQEEAKSQYEIAKQFAEEARRPRTSFEMLPGGEIRVTQRQGENELVETYKSADDLKEKQPELFRKFEKLQGDAGKKALRQ